MTRKSFRIGEAKERIFERDLWTCRVCKRSIYMPGAHPQLGHRISQARAYKYGEDIVYHDECMWTVCGMECNHKVSVGMAHEEQEAERIRKLIEGEE
jgi:hypothetical protein